MSNVIKCYSCQHRRECSDYYTCQHEGDKYYCAVFSVYVDPNDFCSYAEERRKRGKWRRMPMACYGGGTITEYECSVCMEHEMMETNFCPNCGADMRGEQDDD